MGQSPPGLCFSFHVWLSLRIQGPAQDTSVCRSLYAVSVPVHLMSRLDDVEYLIQCESGGT
jgi:hypothetical protein